MSKELRLHKVMPNWLEGKGSKQLSLQENSRRLIGMRHNDQYPSSKFKVAMAVAHPDDVALFEGIEQKLLATNQQYDEKQTGLIVITATDGRGRSFGNLTPDEVGEMRIHEDWVATEPFADATLNLGFTSDGYLWKDKKELTGVLIDVFNAVNADAYLFPHPFDEHADHRLVAESGKAALYVLFDNKRSQAPFVLYADREDGLIIPGWEPSLYYPLSDTQHNAYEDAFFAYPSQTGSHLTETERSKVQMVLDRTKNIGREFGVPYAGRVIQDFNYSNEDPSQLLGEDIFVRS